MEDVELPINFRFEAINAYYWVIVRQYLLGQFRLQLIKWDLFDVNGIIVRECCTYDRMTAVKTKDAICQAVDPEAYLQSLATEYNCEGPGQRIRLDNKPGDR